MLEALMFYDAHYLKWVAQVHKIPQMASIVPDASRYLINPWTCEFVKKRQRVVDGESVVMQILDPILDNIQKVNFLLTHTRSNHHSQNDKHVEKIAYSTSRNLGRTNARYSQRCCITGKRSGSTK